MALEVTDFIVERLLEYDSTFDTGGGIVTTELMVKPLSVVLQPLRDEIDEVKQNQSILTVLEEDDPDSFDEDVVDALASNVFIERSEGGKATGTVRVRYFSPQAVDIGTGLAAFLDSSGKRYLNTNPISITAAEMSLNVDGSLYYFETSVEAEEEGSDGNVDIGGIQEFENEPTNVANVTNLTAFSDGVSRETNTELIDRIEVAVTVRALVTGRGIVTTMQDNFPTILEIKPIGFGDPEMQRDIVYNTHVGGYVDVWVKTPSLTEDSTYDVTGLVSDPTRQVAGSSTVVMLQDAAGSNPYQPATPTEYDLTHSNLDDEITSPVVRSADGFAGYTELSDYLITLSTGKISRVPTGSIFHIRNNTGTTQDDGTGRIKEFIDGGSDFTFVRPGMQLTVTFPSSVAGVYPVKEATSVKVTIYNEFPAVVAGTVQWQIDDVVNATYDYNPLSIDIIGTPRSTAREDYTITNVPVMKVKSIEVLDPSTGEPTGTFLDTTGGYGQGGYGIGPYGIGTGPEWLLRVVEANLRFSTAEDNYLDISKAYTGFSLRVTYDYAPQIAEYQNYVENDLNRVETADLEVKHFIPVFVDTVTSITYKVLASNTSALSATGMQTAVEDLVDTVPIGESLELSDIVDLLYNSGASQVGLGFSLRGEIHNTDGTIEFITSTDDGELTVPTRTVVGTELPQTDKPLTPNIAHFIPGDITLVRTTV